MFGIDDDHEDPWAWHHTHNGHYAEPLGEICIKCVMSGSRQLDALQIGAIIRLAEYFLNKEGSTLTPRPESNSK